MVYQPALYKNSWEESKGVHTCSMGITSKVNVIGQLDF